MYSSNRPKVVHIWLLVNCDSTLRSIMTLLPFEACRLLFETEPRSLVPQHVSVTPNQEEELRKQTLGFVEVKEEEEEEKEKAEGEQFEEESEAVDWPEIRKGWSQQSPRTLLDFLSKVELQSLADGGTALLHHVNVTFHQHIP